MVLEASGSKPIECRENEILDEGPFVVTVGDVRYSCLDKYGTKNPGDEFCEKGVADAYCVDHNEGTVRFLIGEETHSFRLPTQYSMTDRFVQWWDTEYLVHNKELWFKYVTEGLDNFTPEEFVQIYLSLPNLVKANYIVDYEATHTEKGPWSPISFVDAMSTLMREDLLIGQYSHDQLKLLKDKVMSHLALRNDYWPNEKSKIIENVVYPIEEALGIAHVTDW